MTDSDSPAGAADSEAPVSLRPKRLGKNIFEGTGVVTGINIENYGHPAIMATIEIDGDQFDIPLYTLPPSWAEKVVHAPIRVLVTVQEILSDSLSV